MDAKTVKAVIDAKLAGKPHDEKQFEYYHLNRNVFNVKEEVTSLTKVGNGVYRDNLGNNWREVSTVQNMFHMPKLNWVSSAMGITTPYSRKFLRDDLSTGLGGEFEMIIREDGKRIDAIVSENYQETYNFGRTSNWRAHNELDIAPHRKNGRYALRRNMGSVKISG